MLGTSPAARYAPAALGVVGFQVALDTLVPTHRRQHCSKAQPRIGVRELRQHASRYLARVATGETIEVTDRGRPVALLVPTGTDRWKGLIASNQVGAATGEGTVLDDPPGDYGVNASARLAAMREGER